MAGFLACGLSVFLLTRDAPADAGSPIIELCIRHIDRDGRRVAVSPPNAVEIPLGLRLLVCDGVRPVAWADPVEVDGEQGVFQLGQAVPKAVFKKSLRAWLVTADLVGAIRSRWPMGASLSVPIDSITLGGTRAWVAAGERHGVRVGDRWWLRIGGQPAARFDVRFVAPGVCFCSIVPLVADPPIEPGNAVGLWPSPADQRAGRLTSAVCCIEDRSGTSLVWVAAPEGVEVPKPAHLDFYHDGGYIGHGRVERMDDRFWYARFHAASGAERSTAVASPASQPASEAATSCPTSAPVSESGLTELVVGDEVRVRTQEDIRRGRFAARVFELAAEGALISAGEVDGVEAGDRLTMYRGGQDIGRAVVRRVQRSYSVLAAVAADSGPWLALRVNDEARLGPPPPGLTRIGMIQEVVAGTLFTAKVAGRNPPLYTPLAVRSLGRTVAVGILVARDASIAGGFILPCSMIEPVVAGMELAQEPADPTEGDEE